METTSEASFAATSRNPASKASVAALTIYDMCKALSHDIVIGDTRLMSKTGGKEDFHRGG